MKTGYSIGDVMTIKPVKVSISASLKDCAQIMANEHVGSLLVESKAEIVGIVTEQDIVRKGVALLDNLSNVCVDKIMVSDFVSTSPDKDLYDALILMRDYNIRHLPVFSKKELVGFLTIKDILKIEPQLFDLIVEKFELREEERKLSMSAELDGGVCERCGNEVPFLVEASDGAMVCVDCKN